MTNNQQFYSNPPYMGGYNQASMNIYGAPGFIPNPNVQPPKYSNTLTSEQIKMLRDKGDTFSLKLTEEERLRGICLHRNDDNTSALLENPDGSCTCSICHHTFSTIENSPEEVQKATDMILNILQTCKLMYLDMPPEAASEYYQIIPLIEKIPKLFSIAADNFRRHENIPGFLPGQSMSPFAIFNSISSPGYAFPYYNNYQQAGVGYQAPPQQPNYGGYGAPFNGMPAPGYNPFTGQGQQQAPGAIPPMGGYSPQNQGYAYNPQQGQPMQSQPQQAPAPNGAPTQQNASTDGKEVNVTAKFQS